MAYKYTTGSVYRGDIYYEDDAEYNTYLDFGLDSLDLIIGGKSMVKMVEASTDKVTINNGGSDIDFHVKGENQAQLIRTMASDDRVGIGTSSPTSTFEVSGSQGGGLAVTGVNITLDETHFMLMMQGAVGFGAATGVTASLPAATGCGGRIYHIFNETGMAEDPYTGGSAKIACNGSDEIQGADHLELAGAEGNTSVSLVSNGHDGWLIFGMYSQQEENGNGG